MVSLMVVVPDEGSDLRCETATIMIEMFRGRIMPFDEIAAFHFGSVVGPAKLRGETIHFPDGAIAAIAKNHSAAIATRDVRAFQQAGLDVINPWERMT